MKENNSHKEWEKSDRRALSMLLASIFMTGAALSYDAPLIVKITGFYGIADADYGFLLGITTFVFAIASAPWGYWADKYPRIKLILISQAIIAAGMAAIAICFLFNLPYRVFFVIRVLSGIGLAGVGSVAASAVMDTVPLSKRGAVFGWVGIGWVLGGAGGMLLPSVCMLLKISLGVTFLIAAINGVIFTILLFFVKEPRRGAHDEALQKSVGEGAAYTHTIKLSDLKSILWRPMSALLILAMIFFQFPPQVLAIWFITFLQRNHNLSEFIATQIMFLAFIGQPIGNGVGGALTDWAFRKKRSGRVIVMIAMALITPVFLISAMIIPFNWLLFVPLMILANFFMVASGPGITIVSLEANLPEHRGTISALMNIFANMARALAWLIPPKIAIAYGGNYGKAFIYIGAAYVPLALVYFLMSLRVEKDLDWVHKTLEERSGKLRAKK